MPYISTQAKISIFSVAMLLAKAATQITPSETGSPNATATLPSSTDEDNMGFFSRNSLFAAGSVLVTFLGLCCCAACSADTSPKPGYYRRIYQSSPDKALLSQAAASKALLPEVNDADEEAQRIGRINA